MYWREWAQPANSCFAVGPCCLWTVHIQIKCQHICLSQMCALTRQPGFCTPFFISPVFLTGSTVSWFCFCRTRRQLCYQHGISAWHCMSWWYNEIKEVSHTCPHCVLDVWKCLLCNFCYLGERYIFKRRRGVEQSPEGIGFPVFSFNQGLCKGRRREYSGGIFHIV